MGIAEPVGPNFPARLGVDASDERIVGRNTIAAVGSIFAPGIDSQQRAEQRPRIVRQLRHLHVDRATFADSEEKQAVIGVAPVGDGSEGDILAAVRRGGSLDPKDFATRARELAGGVIGHVPLVQHPVQRRRNEGRQGDVLIPFVVDGGLPPIGFAWVV